MRLIHVLVTGALMAAVPSASFAQASIRGVVTSQSGVLPGVTVEASSLALVEQVRSVVTDGEGTYVLTNLPPGNYALVFRLPGFRTERRDEIQLRERERVSVNADLLVASMFGPGVNAPPAFAFLFTQELLVATARALWARLPCERIVLQRLDCFGCRPYRVAFHRRGSGTGRDPEDEWRGRVELHATSENRRGSARSARLFPEESGDFESDIDVREYGRLCYLLTEMKFFEIADRYESTTSGAGWFALTVTAGGTTKFVEDSNMGPIGLWAIEHTIESVAQSLNWRRK